MRAAYLNQSPVSAALRLHADVQHLVRLQQADAAYTCRQQLFRPRELGILQAVQHVQARGSVPAHGADDRRGLYASQTAGAWDGHALYVLYYVPAAGGVQPLRLAAQSLARQRRRVGDSYGLRTACCQLQLLTEHLPIKLKFFHNSLPVCMVFTSLCLNYSRSADQRQQNAGYIH